jgi:hypothetical protein
MQFSKVLDAVRVTTATFFATSSAVCLISGYILLQPFLIFLTVAELPVYLPQTSIKLLGGFSTVFFPVLLVGERCEYLPRLAGYRSNAGKTQRGS